MPCAIFAWQVFLMIYAKTIYFDHAATSYPKPRAVKRAVAKGVSLGGNPGRSGHRMAVSASAAVYAARETVSAFFGAPSPLGVVFTQNATSAINTALFSLLGEEKGGALPHVLYSDMEHNAVIRPLYHLARAGKCLAEEYPSAEGALAVKARIRPETKLIIATHASNVCGRVLPIAEIGKLAKKAGILFLVDASQSAGHIPISMAAMHIDILCVPSHKGLLGPLGAGAVIFADTAKEYAPFLLGGSGVGSLSPYMPKALPEHFEAGSLSVPAILGMQAGMQYCLKEGVEEIGYRTALLEERLRLLLSDIAGITLYLPKEAGSGIISFNHDRFPAEDLAARLDAANIAVRAGLHCAPVAHKTLGTARYGTVRIGLGYNNTKKECERFAHTLREVLSE